MGNDMKAVDTSLLTLLKSTKQFVVPIYQRLYSWGEPQCSKMWDDIVLAGKHDSLGSHFTGSVVYVERSMGTTTQPEPDLIIDGQQRATTVTLLLAALAEYLEGQPDGLREPVDGFSPRKIRGYYLFNELEEGDRQYKLVLTQHDQEALSRVLQGQPSLDDSSRVPANYEFFRSKMEEPGFDPVVLCKGLSKLVIVDVKLEPGRDNPQLVFEAMNSTGKELSEADLIRNFVLMDLPHARQLELYNRYWREIEREFVGVSEGQFDELVRHYLTIKTRSIPRQDELYAAFKDYVASTHGPETIDDLVIDLSRYARRYGLIVLGRESNPELSAAFGELHEVRMKQSYPLLLELYRVYDDGLITTSDVVRVVNAVTTMGLRRGVCGLGSQGLNKTFMQAAVALAKDPRADVPIAFLLSRRGGTRFPEDREFRERLLSFNAYEFNRRSYFLATLENYGRKERVSVSEYTIEHVLPQNPDLSHEWREELGQDWQEVQAKYLHTIGNLTLTGYNSKYSDKPFAAKRDMEGGFRQSPIRLNESIASCDRWDETAITARAELLADLAVTIWPTPTLVEHVDSHSDVDGESGTRSLLSYENYDLPEIRELFESLHKKVLREFPYVTLDISRKMVVALEDDFLLAEVAFLKRGLNLYLNIPAEHLSDNRGIVQDVSQVGRWGRSPSVMKVNDLTEVDYAVGLVRQAYEYQVEQA